MVSVLALDIVPAVVFLIVAESIVAFVVTATFDRRFKTFFRRH
jgi:hypothetical protein